MKITVDANRCVASGHCCFVAPAIFEVRDGKLHILQPAPSSEFREQVEQAVFNCPAEALTIEG